MAARSLGVAFAGAQAAGGVVEWARAAEQAGIDAAFIIEDYFQHAAFSLAGAAAAATERLGLGLGVVNPFTRHPALVAMEAATLAGIAPGRVVLGLGTGVRRWLEMQMALPVATPLASLREAVDVIRRLWRGETVTHSGRAFTLRDVHLEYKPAQPEIPILLGVKGPRALHLAGEIADGVLCSIMASPAHVRRVRKTTEDARRAAVRRGTFPISAYVLIAVSRDRRDARQWVRPLIARYLAHLHGQSILADAGVSEAQSGAVRAALARGETGVDLISDDLVDTVAVAGTADDCRRALARWAEAGLTTPIAVTLADVDVIEQLTRIGGELSPFWKDRPWP